MNDNDSKTLCHALILADSEAQVIKLLSDAGYWNEPRAWRHYGDIENNFSAVGNQSSRPDAALVEKLINSIDARLTNECLIAGIDPEGSKAPQTIQSAVGQFFSMNDNRSNATAREDKRMALHETDGSGAVLRSQRLEFGPREGTGKPCFSIADAGEGQTPDMMPNTLLSLIKSNKLRIPFVQGANSIWAAQVCCAFCGEYGLQLILTRRNPLPT